MQMHGLRKKVQETRSSEDPRVAMDEATHSDCNVCKMTYRSYAQAEECERSHLLHDLFTSMDKNQDGTVNRREVIIACRKDGRVREYLGLPKSFRQGSEEHTRFESVFQGLDADGSREITWEEFVGYMRRGKSDEDAGGGGDAPRPLALEAGHAVVYDCDVCKASYPTYERAGRCERSHRP